jgi:hypothetical protein
MKFMIYAREIKSRIYVIYIGLAGEKFDADASRWDVFYCTL